MITLDEYELGMIWNNTMMLLRKKDAVEHRPTILIPDYIDPFIGTVAFAIKTTHSPMMFGWAFTIAAKMQGVEDKDIWKIMPSGYTTQYNHRTMCEYRIMFTRHTYTMLVTDGIIKPPRKE